MSTLSVATIKSQSSSPPTIQNTSGTQVGTFCRAWVNFNGTGTVAIRASFNVSSITDNGTGNYTVNFTTAMPDANFAVATAISESGVGGQARAVAGDGYLTTSALILSYSTTVLTDYAYIQAAIFR